MADLKIYDLYKNHCDNSDKSSFLDKIDSKVELKINSDRAKSDNNWIEVIEEALPYIIKAIDKPNRLLKNDEEILQIEKTKKVTVDSIQHLSKHTNLIQKIDEDENVVPNKILNVLKEETLATYENRFLYTLILRINDLINIKKEKIKEINKRAFKEEKELKYAATTMVGKENVGINISINSSTDAKQGESGEAKEEDILGKINELEKQMMEIQNMQNYKLFQKARFLLITPPLKMTNALLKNPNLQVAVKLWDYVMNLKEEESGEREQNLKTITNKKLKTFIDESFLLNYVVLNNFQKKDKDKRQEKYIEVMFEDVLEQALEMNVNISEEKLENIINKKYRVIRNKIVNRNLEIEDTFSKAIDKYAQKASRLKI